MQPNGRAIYPVRPMAPSRPREFTVTLVCPGVSGVYYWVSGWAPFCMFLDRRLAGGKLTGGVQSGLLTRDVVSPLFLFK